MPAGDLEWVSAKINTPYGILAVSWKKNKTGLEMNVTIPFNTTAKIYLPVKEENSEITINEVTKAKHHKSFEHKDDKVYTNLTAGKYSILIKQI
jgi:alpha-L-rhamnosidase